jgi:hypothetical protein
MFPESSANAVRTDIELEHWWPVSASDFARQECSDFELDLTADRKFPVGSVMANAHRDAHSLANDSSAVSGALATPYRQSS